DETGIHERPIGRHALDVRDRVIARTDEEQPHERSGQPSEQTPLLPERPDEIPDDNSVDSAQEAHAGLPARPVALRSTVAACVFSKYTSSSVAGRMLKRVRVGANRTSFASRSWEPTIPTR